MKKRRITYKDNALKLLKEFPDLINDKNKFLRIYYRVYNNKYVPIGYIDNPESVRQSYDQAKKEISAMGMRELL